MNWWKIVVVFFVVLGIGVAIFSVYKASVDGLMIKVGLVGSDFGVVVVQEKIAQTVGQIEGQLSCNLPARMRGAITFMLSNDQEQGKLAFTLGRERILCGARILAQGDTEVGTYEVLKGMGYLKQGYKFVYERGQVDMRVCEGQPEADVTKTVEGILGATNGKIYELISNEWQEVVKLQEVVDPLCLDQRMKTR